MSEQIESGGENQEQNAPEVSPVELQAREQGWVPKDDFKGEEHKWVDAGEFLRRGELFSKIESQNKELKAIRETLLQFKDHHSKVQETAYKKAIADLKAKKKEALLEGDADLVIEVDEQLDEVKDQQRRIAAQPAVQEPQGEHPTFVNWKQKNSWYENNKPMRGWADVRGLELAQEGKSPDEVLRIVEREVRTEFAHKFENPNRSKAGAVEAAPQRGSRNDSFELTSDQRTMMNKFVKQGLMTEKEYIDELKALERK